MVSVPVLGEDEALASTPYPTVPFPDPEDPLVTLTMLVELLVAVQAHPAGAFTFTLPLDAPPITDTLVADRL